jgi:cytochrome P450
MRLDTSARSAYWVLDVANEMNSRVFRLSLLSLPPKTLTSIGELSAFRELLTDPLSMKPLRLYSYFRGIYGGKKTVFTLNPDNGWHARRKAVAPAFSSNQIRRMTRVALDKTDAWINNTLDKDDSFDVSKEMTRIVLSALSETAYEYEMSEQEKTDFEADLKVVLIEYTRKSPVIPLRSMLGWFVPGRRRAVAASKRLMSMVRRMMNEYKKKDCTTPGTIIQLIMDSDAIPTEEEKAAQLLEFLVAGHDTTAYSIAFILIELAKNPVEQAKLREALSLLSPESWSSSSQLQWVVKEGMRLHPVARSIRVPGRDIVTSKNEVLPKGSMCIAHFMLLFRNPDIFEDPDTFRPSRWEIPSRDMLEAFQPFSMGRQNCVGQSLARAETFGIVARICSEFELTVEEEGRVTFFLTVKPVGARLKARRVAR